MSGPGNVVKKALSYHPGAVLGRQLKKTFSPKPSRGYVGAAMDSQIMEMRLANARLKEAKRRQKLPKADREFFSKLSDYEKKMKGLSVEEIGKLRASLDPAFEKDLTLLENSAEHLYHQNRVLMKNPSSRSNFFRLQSHQREVHLQSLPSDKAKLVRKVLEENQSRGISYGLYPFNRAW